LSRSRRRSRRREVDASRESNFRQLIALLVVAFVIALGVVIGLRMSSDAIAVLTGVIAGVAASIPTALLLMAVTSPREEEEEDPEWRREPQWRRERSPSQPPPQVIVVSPSNMPQAAPGYPPSYSYPPALPERRREFRIMGCDEDEDGETLDLEVDTTSWHQ